MNLAIAHQSIKAAAHRYQKLSDQCSEVVGLISAIKPPAEEEMPVVELAQALLPLGLCIVHRDVVRQCLEIVKQTEDAEGLSGEDLSRLERGLNAALKGGAA